MHRIPIIKNSIVNPFILKLPILKAETEKRYCALYSFSIYILFNIEVAING